VTGARRVEADGRTLALTPSSGICYAAEMVGRSYSANSMTVQFLYGFFMRFFSEAVPLDIDARKKADWQVLKCGSLCFDMTPLCATIFLNSGFF
jgi:hypothetical protein